MNIINCKDEEEYKEVIELFQQIVKENKEVKIDNLSNSLQTQTELWMPGFSALFKRTKTKNSTKYDFTEAVEILRREYELFKD